MSHPQNNISSKSAFTRFMLGSVLTAFGTARLMRNPKSRMAQGMVVLGAIHAAEGATGYCPTKSLMGKNMSKNAQGMQGFTQMAGNMAQSMTGGNTMKTITNAAQNVVPEVGQLMKDFVSATGGSQSTSGSTNYGGKSATSNASSSGNKSASSKQNNQTKAKSASSNQSNQNQTKSASSNNKTSAADKAATAYQDGTLPSDGMMQNIADTVIDAASTTGQAPRITH